MFIYDSSKGEYERMTNTGADGGSERLIRELRSLLGDDNVALR